MSLHFCPLLLFLTLGQLSSGLSGTLSFLPFSKMPKSEWTHLLRFDHVDLEQFLSSRFKFPQLNNLNNDILPFANQICAIHIDNFFDVHITRTTFPIYLRKPELAMCHLSVNNASNFAWMSIVKRISLQNFTYGVEFAMRKLYHYNYLPRNGETLLESLFPVLKPINIFTHSVNIKPWNCFINLLLFPPSEMMGRLGLPPPVMW